MSLERHRILHRRAFNAGPRLCLGKSVALHEAGMIFARLVHRYRFTLTNPDEQPIPFTTLLMPIKGGLSVSVAKRT